MTVTLENIIQSPKKWSKEETLAAKIAFDALRSARSETAILANYLCNERKRILPGSYIIESDFELCDLLGFEPGTDAGFLTVLIKPYLDYLKKLVIEDEKTPSLDFKQLMFQLCESTDDNTRQAILRLVKDSHYLYSEDEKEIILKVYETLIDQ